VLHEIAYSSYAYYWYSLSLSLSLSPSPSLPLPSSPEPTINIHPSARTTSQPKNPDKVGQRVKALRKKIQTEIQKAREGLRPDVPKTEVEPEQVEYETGYDPATGEVRGPDIELADLPTESFVEREVNCAEDVCKLWTLSQR
jgi:hypothetical protein